MRVARHPGTCNRRGPPAFARVTSLGRGGLISRREKEAIMGPTVIEAPLDASSAPDSAAASSVRLCAQPIQSPLTGGDQAAASEPGEPEPEPDEPEPEYAPESAANQSAGRGGQSKPQLSGGGCPRAQRPSTPFCVACLPYSIDCERNVGAQYAKLAGHPDSIVSIDLKIEFFIGKLRQLNFMSLLSLSRLTLTPATVKLDRRLFAAVLCKEGNQTHVVGLCARNIAGPLITKGTTTPNV